MSLLIAVKGWNPAAWAARLGKHLPEHEVRSWPDAIGDPAAIRYALAWKAPAEALAACPNLEVIFSLGAGVDHLMGDPDLPAYAYNYFSGVPAPAGAGLALLPMILSFDLGYDAVLKHPALVIAWVFFVGLLMVSAIPTYSGKKARVPQGLVIPMLIVVGVLVAAMVNAPWRTLAGLGLLYLLCIPFSIRSYRRLKAEAEKMVAAHEATLDGAPSGVPAPDAGEPRPGT